MQLCNYFNYIVSIILYISGIFKRNFILYYFFLILCAYVLYCMLFFFLMWLRHNKILVGAKGNFRDIFSPHTILYIYVHVCIERVYMVLEESWGKKKSERCGFCCVFIYNMCIWEVGMCICMCVPLSYDYVMGANFIRAATAKAWGGEIRFFHHCCRRDIECAKENRNEWKKKKRKMNKDIR